VKYKCCKIALTNAQQQQGTHKLKTKSPAVARIADRTDYQLHSTDQTIILIFDLLN